MRLVARDFLFELIDEPLERNHRQFAHAPIAVSVVAQGLGLSAPNTEKGTTKPGSATIEDRNRERRLIRVGEFIFRCSPAYVAGLNRGSEGKPAVELYRVCSSIQRRNGAWPASIGSATTQGHA